MNARRIGNPQYAPEETSRILHRALRGILQAPALPIGAPLCDLASAA
jgi:hypothetical protein